MLFISSSRILEQGQHSDVKFMIHGDIFPAHRCVLSARSEYFTTMFETKWKGKNLITLRHPLVRPNAPPSPWVPAWNCRFLWELSQASLVNPGVGDLMGLVEVLETRCFQITIQSSLC